MLFLQQYDSHRIKSSRTATMDELRAVMQETITAFVENNTAAVKKKDVSLLSSVLSDDCIKMSRPLSLVNKYPQFFKAMRNTKHRRR